MKIILASTSPRRKMLLKTLEIDFKQKSPSVEEVPQKNEEPEAMVRRFAYEKALDVLNSLKEKSDTLVIGSDTSVVISGKILGKPKNEKDAKKMLRMISGKDHQVMSGIAVVSEKKAIVKCVVTDVSIKNLRDDEINWYVSTKEPMDKAGAYAAQGLGMFMIKKINGSYTNVVGMPMTELVDILEKDFEYKWKKHKKN